MKRIFLILLLIFVVLVPAYSQQQTKTQCFQLCQSTFRSELTRCRNDYKDNTTVKTSCLDKARISLNDCLEECRDKFEDK
jgi:hypothetical protein